MNCQDHLYRQANPKQITRRWFFEQCGVGLGAIALGHLMAGSGHAAAAANPLAPKQPHFAPKAKRVIFLFMAGAPSHLDLFDNKPQLAKFDGTLPPPELLKGYRAAFINPNSKLLGPQVQVRESTARAARSFRSCCRISAEDRRRYRHRQIDGDRRVQSCAGSVSDEHGHACSSAGRAWARGCSMGSASETQDLPAFVVFSSGSKGAERRE